MFELIVEGIIQCLTPINILFIFVSVILGIIIGALPGFGAATGLIMILPLTYSLDPGTAFVALVGVYVGAEYGGSISSILINTPGTGGAVVTCFDGFPMAQKGKAADALLISNIASFSGGMFSAFLMLLFMPLLAKFALEFGAGEILILAVAGLLLVGTVSKGDMIKGVLSACIGVFITCVGADSFMGHPRFDFGQMILYGGIPFIPVMLGTFSVPHLLNLVLSNTEQKNMVKFEVYGFKDNFSLFSKYFRYIYSKCKLLVVRSSMFGVLIGMIPGVGASVATMVSYSTAKKTSKNPEEFGTGCIEGLVAPESSNNGIVAGSLTPVLALGIPGSPAAAIFMGAIFMHGMTPGPNFLSTQADLVYMLIMSIFLCTIVMLFLGFFSIGFLSNILKISPAYLFPSVITICSIGAYIVRGLDFDIFLFAAFGLITYLLVPLGFNAAACVLGMILGGITERSLMEMLTIAGAKGGIVEYFLSRPLALGMGTLLVLYLVYMGYTYYRKYKNNCVEEFEVECQYLSVGWTGMRKADVIMASVIFVFVASVNYLCSDYPEQSKLFPILLSGIFAVIGILLIIRAFFFEAYYAGQDLKVFSNIDTKAFTYLVAICASYITLINIVGFYVSSTVAVFLLAFMLTYMKDKTNMQKHLKRSLLFTVFFIPFVYLVFHVLFEISTPMGMFI